MSIDRYNSTHRQDELRTIARWIEVGDSGKVIGLAGSGKSNLLQLMCQHPEALTRHFTTFTHPAVLIAIDLNDLPAFDLATFFRTILRSIYESRTNFPADVREAIGQTFEAYWREQDPFVVQSALRALLFCLKEQGVRLVLILDRFDTFCEGGGSREIFNTLRGLRDSFKRNLCYIVGLRYELSYLPDAGLLGELLDLLDAHTCWVGALQSEDALQLIYHETEGQEPQLTRSEAQCLMELSGQYPFLLKALCRWWRTTTPKPGLRHLVEPLLVQPAVQLRLKTVWEGLTQEEQYLMSELAAIWAESKDGRGHKSLITEYGTALKLLNQKGVCRRVNGCWEVNGRLLNQYVLEKHRTILGRISYDRETALFWQGPRQLELSQQQQVALEYLLVNPHQPLSKTDLLMAIWPDEWEDVDESRLYQLVRQLRRKIEPHPARPVYLVNWRGFPEGGYQFFPEGRAAVGQDSIG